MYFFASLSLSPARSINAETLLIVAVAFEHCLPFGELGLEIAGDGVQRRDHRAEQFLQHRGMNGLRGVLDQVRD